MRNAIVHHFPLLREIGRPSGKLATQRVSKETCGRFETDVSSHTQTAIRDGSTLFAPAPPLVPGPAHCTPRRVVTQPL